MKRNPVHTYTNLRGVSGDNSAPQSILHVEDPRVPDSQSRDSIHWKAPTLIASCLVLAALLAVIHHEFYHHWNGEPVGNTTQQQWIVRGGTAFAFLFKAACLISVSTTYAQLFWGTVRSRSYTVANIDSLYAVLGNPFKFVDISLWLRRPLLAAVAIIAWTLPLSAIITPGTITVSSVLFSSTEIMNVPELDFENPEYGRIVLDGVYEGAVPLLVRTALAVSTSGNILQITPPSINSTYMTQFMGPAYSCGPVSAVDQRIFDDSLHATRRFSGGVSFPYFAWVPEATGTNSTPYVPDFTMSGRGTTFDDHSGNKSLLWVYAQGPEFSESTMNETLVVCSLYNASYNVQFEFSSGTQTIRPNIETYENQIGTDLIPGNEHFGDSISHTVEAFVSIMEAFNRIMVGSLNLDHYGDVETTRTLVSSSSVNDTLFGAADRSLVPRVLEQLFQNVTLSLLSLDVFLKNSTTSTPTQVGHLTSRAQYSYIPKALYLAYGIALLCTLCTVLYGLTVTYDNKRSYTNDFSVLLCSMRDEALMEAIGDDACSGSDPLPRHVGKIRLRYHAEADEAGAAGFRRVV